MAVRFWVTGALSLVLDTSDLVDHRVDITVIVQSGPCRVMVPGPGSVGSVEVVPAADTSGRRSG
jgi:hypothetical protein